MRSQVFRIFLRLKTTDVMKGDSMKIAYLGIDLLHPVLNALLKEGCEIMKIFTCPTDNVTEFNTDVRATAAELGIPLTMERFTASDLHKLSAEGCELIVCAGYYYRIPVSEVIPMVNVHPSPLPVGRGAWPMPLIIKKSLPMGGVTIHKMTSEFDCGDILLQESFSIGNEETLQTYMEKLYRYIPEMVRRLVRELPELLTAAVPQGEGEYWPNPDEEEWTVAPDMDVEEADRILRAFYGYECIYRTSEERVELIGARAETGDREGHRFPLRDGYICAESARILREK